MENDFLYFINANEDLSFSFLSKWGRWSLVVASQAVDILAWPLIMLTPIVLIKNKPRLQKVLLLCYFFFALIVATDLLLDPRITNPKFFFDKFSRIPAGQMKEKYREILSNGPF